MIYCCSDIHGMYDKYIKLLEVIDLKDDDTLFVLGDIVDRGEDSIKIIMDMMKRPNVICLIGNHDYMAMLNFKFLLSKISEDTVKETNFEILTKWFKSGGKTTFDEFVKLNRQQIKEIMDYMSEFRLYATVNVNNQDYVLVHGGLANFSEKRELNDYDLYEIIFERTDYHKQYFKDKYLVTGHTPTCLIHQEENNFKIYKGNHHIAIDCGAVYGGYLGAICLNNGKEFYV